MQIRYAHGDVVQTGAAFFQKLCDRGTRVERFEQFDAGRPRRQHRSVDLLRFDGLARQNRQSELRRVERQRFVDRAHRDAEMVDFPMLRCVVGPFALSALQIGQQFGHARALDGNCLENSWNGFTVGESQHAFDLALRLPGSRPVRLVDDKHVGDLHDARL